MGHRGWALAAALTLATDAGAQEWEHVFYPPEDDGFAVCAAGVYYSDGPFVVRLYDRTIDFYLQDDELALPPERMLGTVVLVFQDIDFVLRADSGWAEGGGRVDHLFLTPADQDIASLLSHLRHASEMDVAFPDGLAYTIDLRGSSAALYEAFECWDRKFARIASRGGGRNPFAASEPLGRNPFE